jgi:hypothetical protein
MSARSLAPDRRRVEPTTHTPWQSFLEATPMMKDPFPEPVEPPDFEAVTARFEALAAVLEQLDPETEASTRKAVVAQIDRLLDSPI